jgi:hypothetical protein
MSLRAQKIAVAAIIFCAVLAGCKKRVPPPAPPPPPAKVAPVPPAAQPRIQLFEAEPAIVEPGQPATLRWSVAGATDVQITPGIGAVPESGSRQIFPRDTTSYKLLARGPGGTAAATSEVRVEIAATAPPPDPQFPKPVPTEEPKVSTAEERGKRVIVHAANPAGTSPGRGLSPAGYAFSVPDLKQNQRSVARLLLDPQPIVVQNQEELKRELARVPSSVAGRLTAFANEMRALLSGGSGLSVHPLGPAEQSIVGPTEWFWEINPVEPGERNLRLDLQAKVTVAGRPAYVPVDPFPEIRRQIVRPAERPEVPPVTDSIEVSRKPAAPQSSTPPRQSPRQAAPGRSSPWWLAGALLATALLFPLWKYGRGRFIGAAPVLAEPEVRIQVIHGRDEQRQAERFCRELDLKRCQFLYAPHGIAIGSESWQNRFLQNLQEVDSVVVLLTAAALVDEWVNWQVEQAVKVQAQKQVPIYPIVMDQKVSRAASTLARLNDFPWMAATAPQERKEIRNMLSELHPSRLRRLSCFLSYSRHSPALAERLFHDLEARGINCWRDVNDLRGGVLWEREIASAIDSSTHVLILITRESLQSQHVADEIAYAREKGKIIIPLLEQQVELPFGLQRVQAINFVDSYEAGFERLLKDLISSGAQAHGAA